MKGVGTPQGSAHARAQRLALVALHRNARYMTPTGRICRLLSVQHSQPGRTPEATFAYELPSKGVGPRELGERITMKVAFAQRSLVRIA